jgi:hypothetical protein
VFDPTSLEACAATRSDPAIRTETWRTALQDVLRELPSFGMDARGGAEASEATPFFERLRQRRTSRDIT